MTTRNLTLAAAAALVITVVGGVLLFAVPRPPALPELSADVTAFDVDPGRLAWTSWEGNQRCLVVLDGDGDRDRHCAAELDGEVIGWDDGEVVVRGYAGGSSDTVRVDPDTGRTRSAPGRGSSDAGGRSELAIERDDGQLTVEVEGRTVWQVDAPQEYTVSWAQVDADGQLVLLQDRAGRLLLVPADGSLPPRVWADDLPSWGSVVWDRT